MSVTVLRKVSVSGGTVLRAANNLGDVASAATSFTNIKQAATTSATGVAELATDAEARTGTDTARVPSVASMRAGVAILRNALAAAQGLVFDGTAGAPIANVPALGINYTIVAWLNPTVLPSGGSYFVIFGAAGSIAYLNDAGAFVVDGASNTPTILTGKMQMYAYSCNNATAVGYVDGKVAQASHANANSQVAPTRLGDLSGGTKAFKGTLRVQLYNRGLSATEIEALYESGAPATADYNNATNTNQLTGDDTAFTSGLGSWALYASATLSNPAANLVITGSAAIAGQGAQRASTLTVGKRYRATILASVGAGTLDFHVQFSSNVIALTTTPTTFIVEFVADNTTFFLFWNNPDTTARVVTIDDVVLLPLGLLCAPEQNAPGNGSVWNDRSGNGAHIILPASGVAWNIPSAAVNKVRGTTNTNGNQQMHAANVLPANCQITRIRARSRTGTPTVTLGTASGGAQLVSSVALSTTWKDLTIALTGGIVSAAASVWVGSNSTDVVEVDITIEPLGF